MANKFTETLLLDIQQMERDCLNQAMLIRALRKGGRRNTEKEQLELDELVSGMGKVTEYYNEHTKK